MHSKLSSSASQPPRSHPASWSLALLAAGLVATAGLPPEEQPKAPPVQPPPPVAVPATLQIMHNQYLREFEKAPDFGLSRTPHMRVSTFVTLAGVSYLAPKPDLIALETKPVAYRSLGREMIGLASLTNSAARSRLQTRPISAEEARAIAELREGAEMVQKETTVRTGYGKDGGEVPGLLVVGALRAKATCARCHECPQGTLLGAFSYTLVPALEQLGVRLPRIAPAR